MLENYTQLAKQYFGARLIKKALREFEKAFGYQKHHDIKDDVSIVLAQAYYA